MKIDEVIGIFECKKCGYRCNLTIDMPYKCPICKKKGEEK